MNPDAILVTGAAGPAGRSICDQLRRLGQRMIGVDMAAGAGGDPPILPVPAANDPKFPATLFDLAEQHGVSVIIPTVTEELPVLAPFAGGKVPIVIAPLTSVAIANDKWWTCRYLDVAGVAVPRFQAVAPGFDPAAVAEQLGWPFVSKPRTGRGGRGVTVHRRHSGQPPTDLPALAQEFAPGTEYAVNLYCPGPGGRHVAVVLEKTGLAQGEIGNATTVRRVAAPDVADLAIRASRALYLHGPADLDIRRRADGRPVVLEVNARFGAHSAAAPEVLQRLLEEYRLVEGIPA